LHSWTEILEDTPPPGKKGGAENKKSRAILDFRGR